MLNFVKGFLCIYWDNHMLFIFQFVTVVYHIDWFADIKESLYSWDKTHLVMVYDFLKYVVGFCLLEFCQGFLHLCSSVTQTLKDTMDQLDLIDIYRTFHPKKINFTFFSSAHGTFSRIDHILGHKSSLGKFKKMEIIPVIFFWPQCSKIRSQLQEKNY